MKPYGIRYLVSYHPAMYGLPADTAGCLDVVNTITGNVFWYDNYNEEWHKSIYSAETTLSLLNIEDNVIQYKEVESFNNGFVNTADLWNKFAQTSLVRRFPQEFVKNLEFATFEPEM